MHGFISTGVPMTGTDFGSILSAMLPRLRAMALRLCGNSHDADDLVQRACLRALERVHQLQPETAPLSWMFSILHSTWLNEVRAQHVRHRSRVDWDDDLMEMVADTAAPDPPTKVLNAQIIEAVEQLPETQRVTMLLVAVEGLSYQETANILDVPIGTVMSRLSRARQAISARIEPTERHDIRTKKKSEDG